MTNLIYFIICTTTLKFTIPVTVSRYQTVSSAENVPKSYLQRAWSTDKNWNCFFTLGSTFFSLLFVENPLSSRWFIRMALPHNSLTDKEYSSLAISIGKAFSSFEAPIKSKHVRAITIGSYHSNGGHAFWTIAIRQPLQENRITAWKFCNVLHKLLRDGHPLVIQHSMRQRNMITDMGKLWGHLNDGYGFCIKQYTKLLVTKLEFHDRNPRFPGSLVLKKGELDRENDINLYFQLSVEMVSQVKIEFSSVDINMKQCWRFINKKI